MAAVRHLGIVASSNPSTGATCARDKGIKKERKKKKQGKKLTVAN